MSLSLQIDRKNNRFFFDATYRQARLTKAISAGCRGKLDSPLSHGPQAMKAVWCPNNGSIQRRSRL